MLLDSIQLLESLEEACQHEAIEFDVLANKAVLKQVDNDVVGYMSVGLNEAANGRPKKSLLDDFAAKLILNAEMD